jgi:hypothetical protein
VVLKWIRSRAARPEEPPGQQCTRCRTTIAGATEDELRAAGGVLLASVGWFCGPICERQYRLKFRIQPAGTPADGSKAAAQPGTRTPKPQPPVTEVAETAEAPSSGRRSAADLLTEALRARRRQLNNGV